MYKCRKCSSENLKYDCAQYKDSTIHLYCTCRDCFARYNVSQQETPKHLLKDMPIRTAKELIAEYKKLRRKSPVDQYGVLDTQVSLF